jgi:ABC-type multidrug transport system ATPase subunit
LMPSLTVYETILYSAMLRLPKDISLAAKKFRVLQTMTELQIMNIRDSRIGGESGRGISGGEKRRVTIACELVTSPSIVFMDEPTSGLDAYNAFNVVEALVTLARDFNRTIVFTIHQPRSNIVAMFDQLVLLASGSVVYSGPLSKCQGYFDSIGHPCPSGFNIADYLVDLTMQAEQPLYSRPDLEDGQPLIQNGSAEAVASDAEYEPPTRQRQTRNNSGAVHIFEMADGLISDELKKLVDSYARSEISQRIKEEILNWSSNSSPGNDGIPTVAPGYQRIGIWKQFAILSQRTFKVLYRNPMLMLTHYTIAIVMGCE